jgi:hypothetical protein
MAMKFKTFRNLVIGGLILVVCGAGFAYKQMNPSDPHDHSGHDHGAHGSHDGPKTPADRKADLEAKAREMEAKANGALGDLQKNRDPHADPMLAAILKRIEEPLSGSKVKDAFKGRAYKVNLYGSGGKVERLKIDLDRDNAWDEKWSCETPGVLEGLKRRISSADDDTTYDKELFYRGGVFRPKEGSAPPPSSGGGETAPSSGGGDPAPATAGLEPHQRQLIEKIQSGIGGPGKLKDPFKSGPKVNIYHDEGEPIPNRAKVDLDRDGQWDEKWNFERTPEGLKVKRQVSTGDDGSFYDKDYRLRDGKWVLK